MRFFKIVLVLSICTAFLVACKKDDLPPEIPPPAPFNEQEPKDFEALVKFLKEYSMKVTDDFDVTFEKIPTQNTNNLVSIYDKYKTELEKPKEVLIGGYSHKFFYISFKEGSNLAPTRVDQIFVSYKGFLLNNTIFDQQNQALFDLFSEIKVQGWREVLPKFKTGSPTQNSDGTTTYDGYGAGVMFIPSSLAYYNRGSDGIPAYAPLIFSFKLFQLNYLDQDGDGILSKNEDINSDGLFNNDDTDEDGIQNFLDADDDGDNYLTKAECKFTYIDNGVTKIGYYPFEGTKDDDILTPIDESKGVPDCSGKFAGDRKRRYLDKSCYKD
jgi:FKBP-type peptidyl-prolyl cis-trans isomerase FkpA